MQSSASEIARRLGENAEAVCRRYLANGRREGHYWMVGDMRGSKGRSLYVRLDAQSDGRAAGKWTDAASGEHGDLLDIIAASCGHMSLRETLAEARRFLSLPVSMPSAPIQPRSRREPSGTPDAARRLWAASKPIAQTTAAAYLAARLLPGATNAAALRFHPHCFYRPSDEDAPDTRNAWPAMIAAATDDAGTIMGVHRTWLDPASKDKAPVAYPRRAMGHLLGHGVRFGPSGPVMAAGEGIETILSLREIAPALPLIAGLSAAHLAGIQFPSALRRLYVARDADPAGLAALAALVERATPIGIEVRALAPARDDLNSDIMSFGRDAMTSAIASQLLDEDVTRFLGR